MRRVCAYGVHVLTAAGALIAFLALAEIASRECDPRWVLFWFVLATILDGLDGPLARYFDVKRYAPGIAGRTLDDTVDYLNFTFVPLFFIWRMGWVPWAEGASMETAALWGGVWVVPAMMASLFGFANVQAKQESAGFFSGFPSYWNIVAYFAGLLFIGIGAWANAVLIVLLTILTLAPVRFLYPSRAPSPWNRLVMIAGAAWGVLLLWTLPDYPYLPSAVVWLLVAGVLAYVVLSAVLDWRDRKQTMR